MKGKQDSVAEVAGLRRRRIGEEALRFLGRLTGPFQLVVGRRPYRALGKSRWHRLFARFFSPLRPPGLARTIDLHIRR